MVLSTAKRITDSAGSWQVHDVLPMDDAMFRQWRDMLESRIGVSILAERKSFLLTSLAARMKEIGCETYNEYLEFLESGSNGVVEWEILVDRLTVHETRFYRDKNALSLLEKKFLSSLGEETGETKKLDFWSVGCATGEEPYTLAIAVDDYLQKHDIPAFFSVTATDISRASLTTARGGIYHRNRLKNLPVRLLRKYFLPHDLDHYRLDKALRDRVCFTLLNLIDSQDSRIGKMDVIFCQNVLIYFRNEKRLEIVNQLAGHLRSGGILILGAGEVLNWQHPNLKNISTQDVVAYQCVRDDEVVS